MNRLSFLKRLGIGATAAVVAPSAFMNESNTKFIDRESIKEPIKCSSYGSVNKVFIARENPTWASVSSMRSMTLEEMAQMEAVSDFDMIYGNLFPKQIQYD